MKQRHEEITASDPGRYKTKLLHNGNMIGYFDSDGVVGGYELKRSAMLDKRISRKLNMYTRCWHVTILSESQGYLCDYGSIIWLYEEYKK